MNKKLSEKIRTLPITPGVYFHKSKAGEIIYIGKASVLKNRVKQYFQNSRDFDIKTRALISEIDDVDWVETESEIDALFLEGEMVKRYMPRFNILLRDDKSLIFVRINMQSEWPHVSFTHVPIDDGAEYFGPYLNSYAVKKALRYLRRIFPYYDSLPKVDRKPAQLGQRVVTPRIDLNSHLGLSPNGITSGEYKSNLRKLISYMKGNRKKLISELEIEMKHVADQHDFERATILRNQIRNLKELQQRILFGDKEFIDISKDEALSDLTILFGLARTPIRIEGFDISHIGGVNVVASMVVFTNGVSDRSQYRKFKTHTDRNDDYFNIRETITRRFSERNIKKWGQPDLVLIDGGKGQLDSALRARDVQGYSNVPFIGLAKQDELIVIKNNSDIELSREQAILLDGSLAFSDDFTEIHLPQSSHVIKLLQRIRDESHRFAISYNATLNKTKQTSSRLDEISGIGPKTKSKLMRRFGSLRGISDATELEVALLIGASRAKLVFEFLKSYNSR